jgi:glycosyltransferase involved in cell wall biosynthesis/MoaA/NifB/PqqE/SkfB family radical SAM enzyme
MHILIVIHGYPPNYNAGSEVYTQSICTELSKHHKVSVFTREENPYTPDFAIHAAQHSENLSFYYLNHPQGKDGYRHSAMDAQFSELVQALQPNVAHLGHLNHLSTGLVDVLASLQIPMVYTLHDFWLMCPRGQFLTRSMGKINNFELCKGQNDRKCATDCYSVYFSGKQETEPEEIAAWEKWIRERMEETRSIVHKIDLFIAPSRYLRNRFIQDFGFPEDKIHYLDYGFPLAYLTPSSIQPQKRKEFTFGYIGTHIPSKGINQLLEAFSTLTLPARLVIFGRENGQSTRALKELAQASKNPVEFAGEYINQNLANEVFSKVDCIVVPSIWMENSPLVIHEAQACHIPVITARAGGMQEYVEHGINGLLFEHRKPDSLAQQMEWAIQHPDEMTELGKRGYLFSEDGCVPSIQAHTQSLVSLYRTVIPEGSLWRITLDTNPEDCNLQCIMCEEHSPYSNFIPNLFKETGVRRRRMEFDTVRNLFAQASELGVREIIPSTMGEPLLYKEFDQIFELANQYGIKINLTTNGTFPKKPVAEWARLIVPNTSDVKISWNGATKDTAERVMKDLDFDKAISNVKEFIRVRDAHFEATGVFCRVTFQLTFMQNNMHELADIIKLAASLGVDRVKGHQLWAHFEEIKDLSMKATDNSRKKWNRYVAEAYTAAEEFRKPNGEKVFLENILPLEEDTPQEVPESYECPFLRKEIWVSATGTYSPCCAPDNLRRSLGNFGTTATHTVKEVFRSPQYQNLVRNYKSIPLCQTCNMRKPKEL